MCGNIEISIIFHQLVLEPMVTSALARARPTSRHRTISTRLNTGRHSSIMLVTNDGTLFDMSTGRSQPLTPDYLNLSLSYLRSRYTPSMSPKRTLLIFDTRVDRGSWVSHVSPKAYIYHCDVQRVWNSFSIKDHGILATLPRHTTEHTPAVKYYAKGERESNKRS